MPYADLLMDQPSSFWHKPLKAPLHSQEPGQHNSKRELSLRGIKIKKKMFEDKQQENKILGSLNILIALRVTNGHPFLIVRQPRTQEQQHFDKMVRK